MGIKTLIWIQKTLSVTTVYYIESVFSGYIRWFCLFSMKIWNYLRLFYHYKKGTLSRYELFFLKTYYGKYVLSVHALIVFTIFCFVLTWKNQTQCFSLLLWNYLLILKILPVTRFNDSKAAILPLKMLTGSHLWFCKIIPKAARWLVNCRAFSL